MTVDVSRGDYTETDLPDAAFAAVWVDESGTRRRALQITDETSVRAALAHVHQLPVQVRDAARRRVHAAADRFRIPVWMRR